jgi:hypothetical protein
VCVFHFSFHISYTHPALSSPCSDEQEVISIKSKSHRSLSIESNYNAEPVVYDISFDIPIGHSAVDEITVSSTDSFRTFIKLVATKLGIRSSTVRLLYRTSWKSNEKARILVNDDASESKERYTGLIEHSVLALSDQIPTRSKKEYKVLLLDDRTADEKKKSVAQAEAAKQAARRKVSICGPSLSLHFMDTYTVIRSY